MNTFKGGETGSGDPFQFIEEGPAGWFLLNLLLWAAVFVDYL